MEPLLNEIVGLLSSRTPSGRWTAANLADALGVSRARMQGGLDELKALGYGLDADARGTVRISVYPDRMIDTEILRGLKTRIFAKQLHCYNRIGSTNTRATELAESGAPEGTIVVAEEQTGGRGRLGRSWHSAAGRGIWSSVILRPQVPLQRASGLSLLAALAFAQTAERELGLQVDLKWPNDGLLEGRKVMGVLTEVSAEVDRVYHVVCGTGINVGHQLADFPPSLQSTATSLAIAMDEPVDRLAIYRAFVTRFELLYRRFCRSGIAPFLDDYRKRSILLGREVVVQQGHHAIRGRAVAIDENGALIVRQGRENTVIFAGEASLRES